MTSICQIKRAFSIVKWVLLRFKSENNELILRTVYQ